MRVNAYERIVLPRLLHGAMRDPRFTPLRARAAGRATGRVIEIGVGSGLNFEHYGGAVQAVVGVDTSPSLLAKARDHGSGRSFDALLVLQRAEALPFADASFDTAVSSWTMCSLGDPSAALAELRRVLRPGAPLHFVEHGRHVAARVASWQHRLTPVWRRIAGNCHLDRDVPALIRRAGFTIDELETGMLVDGPAILAWQFLGTARTACR